MYQYGCSIQYHVRLYVFDMTLRVFTLLIVAERVTYSAFEPVERGIHA